jgi:hypothetical protein
MDLENMKSIRFACILSVVGFLSTVVCPCFAQNESQTGLPPWSSFASDSFSSVNLANLNIHYEIPLRKLPARGLPLNARLASDTNTLGPPGALYGAGSQIGWMGTGVNYVAGTPLMGNFVGLGFKPGYISYTTTSTLCNYNGSIYHFNVYTNFS